MQGAVVDSATEGLDADFPSLGKVGKGGVGFEGFLHGGYGFRCGD